MDRAESGLFTNHGLQHNNLGSLRCVVEVGSQAMLVQKGCERRGWHKLCTMWVPGPEIYRNLHDRSVKSASGGWLLQALCSSRKGNPASRQTRSHGFVCNGLTPVDAVDAVVVVSRAPCAWASERLRSARQGLPIE